MSVEANLLARSGSRCELCSSQEDLGVYSLMPANGASPEDNAVLLCHGCRENVSKPGSLAIERWFGLSESIWSEFPAVKVLAYRVLKSLGHHAWANDLLNQIYLEDELLAWAESGEENKDQAKEGERTRVLDSNGTVLEEGDTVTLIKDLEVKGAHFTAKRGTTVKNISLTDDPKFIEGRVNGTRIVLVAAYLKKQS